MSGLIATPDFRENLIKASITCACLPHKCSEILEFSRSCREKWGNNIVKVEDRMTGETQSIVITNLGVDLGLNRYYIEFLFKSTLNIEELKEQFNAFRLLSESKLSIQIRDITLSFAPFP